MRPWTAGLDLGTTSIKAVLLDPEGRIAAGASRPAPLREVPGEGRAEFPPGAYEAAARSALEEALRGAPGRLLLGLASQRSTVVAWNARTGRTLGPALSWRDRRLPGGWPPLTEGEVVRRTGLRLSPHYSAGKIRSLLKGRKGAGLRAAPLASWLAWRWSGGRILAADPTLAQRTLLWNLGGSRWDPALTAAFGIPRSALPEVLSSSADYGTLRLRRRELVLGAMIGDQQAAAAALGLERGLALLNLGTGAFLLVPTGRILRRAPGLLSAVLRSDASGTRYALEGTVNSAGALFDRMRRSGLGDPAREPLPPPREALGLPACLPALAGTGAPRWDAGAGLRFVPDGGSPRARRRAALLAVAYRLREIWDALPRDSRPGRILATGGLARSEGLLQAVSDLLGVPLHRAGLEEAGALGAALLARGEAGSPPRDPSPVLPRASREAGYRRWRRLLR